MNFVSLKLVSQRVALEPLVVSVLDEIIVENLRGCVFDLTLSFCDVPLFFAGDIPRPIDAESLPLLVFVKWTCISDSRLLSAVGNLLIDTSHLVNFLVVLSRLIFFDLIVQTLQGLSLQLAFLPRNLRLRSLGEISRPLIC